MAEHKYFPVNDPCRSFWLQDESYLKSFRTTQGLPAECDIVIIGSGLTGAAIAHFVQEANSSCSITLIEARDACSGASARNGGHMKSDVYASYLSYKTKYGARIAERLLDLEANNFWSLKHFIESKKVNCDFKLTRAIDVCMTNEAMDAAKTSYYERVKDKGDMKKLDVRELPQAKVKALTHMPEAKWAVSFIAGSVWPYKLAIYLLEKAISKGLNLQTNTLATCVQSLDNGRVIINTSRGNIMASKVVFATNGYTCGILPEYISKIVPAKGTACSINVPKSQSRLNTSYGVRWGPALMDYMISRDDAIILGGAKSTYVDQENLWKYNVDDSTLINSASQNYFQNYMTRNFDNWSKDHEASVWSGILGYSDNNFPYVGQVPNREGCFICAGFTGRGMSRIWVCAEAIAAALLGNFNLLERLPPPYTTKPSREPITAKL